MNNLKTAQAVADRLAAGDRELGRVTIKEDGPYCLLNYTPEAMYGGDMTEIEKACRGLVVREDGRIMALPMPKFFNLGEPQCPALPDECYEIWCKIDGSLGIWWHDGEAWRCNTRGSFDNEYVEFALDWQRKEHLGNLDDVAKHWTVMTEICIDDDVNPRAAYNRQGLYLIAIRDKHSGKDISPHGTGWRWGHEFLSPGRIVGIGLDKLLDWQTKKEGQEGWVVRYDSGFRVKIKTAWYLRMFRAVMYLTPKHIREMMLEAGENWIEEFPDDLRPEALAIQEEIEQRFQSALSRIYGAYAKVASIEPRKQYALTVLDQYPDIASWLFALRDGKFDESSVLKKLEL